ncbi:MAG: hypothetical protein VX776_04010, partial [Planctomycetota bacterium]|nr:hypothetical protein [Planctomycetota bacterium]
AEIGSEIPVNVGDFGQTRRSQSVSGDTTFPIVRHGARLVLNELTRIGGAGSQDSAGSLAD